MTAGPIRIHRVIARLNVGGPAMHVVHLTRALDQGAFRTRLLAGGVGADEGDMGYFAAERGVPVSPLPELVREVSPSRDLRTLWRLIRTFRRERPHVVHTHTAKAGALGRLAARLAGVPVVVHTYHGHVLGGGYFSPAVTAAYREVERQLARVTDALVTLTPGLARELSEVHGVAPLDRFRVVPLGLELEPFLAAPYQASRRTARSELGVPDSRPVVGVVGRLVPIKNHELLLQALQRVRVRIPEAELWVVGGGEREAALREEARRLGVDGSVRWLGWRSDLDRIYPALDVLALSSLDEGTPVALLEGMAAGLPVVATRVGGVPEIFADSGYPVRLVPSGSAPGMAAALVAALEERGEGGVGRSLREAVVDRYSVERLAAELGELYRRLLRRTAFPGAAEMGSSGP